MQTKLETIGFHLVERSWLNPVDGIRSVHRADDGCPLLFSNGKGASELAARAGALLTRTERFFGIEAPGRDFAGCARHRRLLEACGKVHRAAGAAS